MLDRIKTIVIFIIRQPKDMAIIILSLICIFLNWQIGCERRQRARPSPTDLPIDTKQIVTVYRDRIITKWREGPTKIEYRDRYIPPEGHVEIVTKEDGLTDKPEIRIKDRGFTLRPGGGMIYSERLLLEADVKFAYWRRYGLAAGVTADFAGIGATRHIDDWVALQNLELQGNLGISWQGDLRFGFGVRTNF